MKRYKLLFNNVNIENLTQLSYKEIEIQFSPNLPKSMMESIEAFNAVHGQISESTSLSLLDFIDDPNEELEKMKKEREKEEQQSDALEYPETFEQDNQPSNEKVDDEDDRG